MSTNNEIVAPGSWLGMLGGGQLGRMFTQSAQRLGYHVAVFDYVDGEEPKAVPNCPAAQVADMYFGPGHGGSSITDALLAFAERCEVVTLEFENLKSDFVRQVGRFAKTRPSADFLELAQNRVREKSKLRDHDFPVTPFRPVSEKSEVLEAAEELGWPLVIKTATSGYDGKGQVVVRTAEQLDSAWEQLDAKQLIAEKWIEFEAEVSVVTARNLRGQAVSYPLFENSHSDHILDVTRCPASKHLTELEPQAHEIAERIAETFGVIGLFCVEFFVGADGELLINEIAPRPHNSGHLTIEAFSLSQFDLQVRAVCNLSLPSISQVRPAAMCNLLGDVWEQGEPNWEPVLDHPEAQLHLYGKDTARLGRKMGHITVLDESSSEAAITARELRDAAAAGPTQES